VLRYAKHTARNHRWAEGLPQRGLFKPVAVAPANKTARIAWAALARGETYRSTLEAKAALQRSVVSFDEAILIANKIIMK
jgi:hypothetical protein